MRVIGWVAFAAFVCPLALSLALRHFSDRPHWSAADHESTGQAPSALAHPAAVAQVYAARTWGLRGALAVHTWLAVKRAGASSYTRYEVIGWRLSRTGSALVRDPSRAPDGLWFSNSPQLLAEVRGAAATAAIDKIEAAVAAYPYDREYRLWPGPNSNTFTAFVARRVPELGAALPSIAIGKDYLADAAVLAPAPSGTGGQFSIFGLAGVLLAAREGLEVNLLGFVAGVRFHPFGVKLPGLGAWPRERGAARRNP